MFTPAYLGRPKNLHEIARLCFGEIVKILSQIHFVEEACGARAVGVPAAPNPLTIALTANHQAFECRVIEMERTAGAQGFDCFHENKVGRARAVTRRGCVRQNKKFSGFEMGRRLQPDCRHSRSGITTTFGHLPDLFEDNVVKSAGCDLSEEV